MAATQDPATRIITHMNNDHGDSLTRYLEHYCGVSSSISHYARLSAFSRAFMTIKALGSTYRIPFDPPLGDFAEARSRVTAMDHEAIEALGRHPITLKSYTRPHEAWQVSIFGLVIATVLLMGRRSNLAPGSRSIFQPVSKRFPALFPWLWRIQPSVMGFIIVAHLGEAWWMEGRLRRHSVPRFSRLWFQWVSSALIEGFGSFWRLDGMIASEEEKKEKRMH